MGKMKLIFVFITLFVGYHSLAGQYRRESQLIDINILKSFKEKENVPLSRFVEHISYIPLETSPGTIFSDNAEFNVTDEFIIVKNGKSDGKYQILLFDRATGKFVREIGKSGIGPDEYLFPSNIPFNPVKREIYALGPSRQIIVYDLSGNNSDKINLPVWRDISVAKSEVSSDVYNILQSVYVQYYNTLDTNIFVGYVRNMSGLEKRKIVLFSKNSFLRVFPNYLKYSYDNSRHSWQPPGGSSKFYKWNNELYFIEAFCDTLYHITKDKMIPRYYFNFGKFNPPYSKQPDIMLNKHWDEYFFLLGICENQNYIFINYLFNKEIWLGIIDKKNNNVTTCMTGPSGESALTDDVSGLMDVIPLGFTQNNEMFYIIKPLDLKNWLEENPPKAIQLRESQPWLKEIDEFSNPIIAFGKCKDNSRQ